MEYTYLVDSKEADIAYMEACDAITYTENIGQLEEFMEDGDRKNPIKILIEKLKNLCSKIKNMIVNLVNSVKYKNTQKVADKLTKNSKLANRKVKIRDWSKIFKLNKEYEQKIKAAKTKEAAEKLRKEYKKKRAILIGAGTAAAAVITVSLGILVRNIKKGGKKEVQEVDKTAGQAIAFLEDKTGSVEAQRAAFRKDVNNLGAKNAAADKKANDKVALEKEVASAISEISANNMNDVHKSFNEQNRVLIEEIERIKVEVDDVLDVDGKPLGIHKQSKAEETGFVLKDHPGIGTTKKENDFVLKGHAMIGSKKDSEDEMRAQYLADEKNKKKRSKVPGRSAAIGTSKSRNQGLLPGPSSQGSSFIMRSKDLPAAM